MSAPGRSARGRAARTSGRRGEILAALLLRLKGYRIIDRCVRTPVGEIDLIVRRGQTIIFVEVKRRAGRADAFDALRADQRQRIIRASEWYLARRADLAGLDRRHDVVVIVPRRWPTHLVDAWRGDGV